MSSYILRNISRSAADQSNRRASTSSTQSKAVTKASSTSLSFGLYKRRRTRCRSVFQLGRKSSPSASASASRIQGTETWKEQKENFLKHPMLRRKSNTEKKRKPHKRSRRGCMVAPIIKVEDWSAMDAGLRISGVFDKEVTSSLMATQDIAGKPSVSVSSPSLPQLASPREASRNESSSNVNTSESIGSVAEKRLSPDSFLPSPASPSSPVSVDAVVTPNSEDGAMTQRASSTSDTIAVLVGEERADEEVTPSEIHESQVSNEDSVDSTGAVECVPTSSLGDKEEVSNPHDPEPQDSMQVLAEEQQVTGAPSKQTSETTSYAETQPLPSSSSNALPSEYVKVDSLSLSTAVTLFSPRLVLEPLVSHMSKKSRWIKKSQFTWPMLLESLSPPTNTSGAVITPFVLAEEPAITVKTPYTYPPVEESTNTAVTPCAPVEEPATPSVSSPQPSQEAELSMPTVSVEVFPDHHSPSLSHVSDCRSDEAVRDSWSADFTPALVSFSSCPSLNITHFDIPGGEDQDSEDNSALSLVPYPDVFDLDEYLEKRWSSIGASTAEERQHRAVVPMIVVYPPSEDNGTPTPTED